MSPVSSVPSADSAAALAHFSASLSFETHCNGATRAAIRLAQLGRPVKVMIGGITGWLDEGFQLAIADEKLPRCDSPAVD
ncbi:hypothetical protein [Paraburkholderia sp. SIMBA_030]|uniref:hypothetical protein n=1 Tax=Paraburkholderia sp. SIMBA_030 TaxID=3085773 RepID=UPI00397B1103